MFGGIRNDCFGYCEEILMYPEDIIGWLLNNLDLIGAMILIPVFVIVLLIAGFGWLIFLVTLLLKIFGVF